MSVVQDMNSLSLERCPFYSGGKDQSCLAVDGLMRCSLFEIEHFCTREEHAFCPVYQERMRTREVVSMEVYEVKLQAMEFQQVA